MRQPATFDDARKTLLELECARRSAQGLQGDRHNMGAFKKKTPYSKTKYSNTKPTNENKDDPKKVRPICDVCNKFHFPYCPRKNKSEDPNPPKRHPKTNSALHIAGTTTSKDVQLKVDIKVEGIAKPFKVHGLPDTGAETTVMSERHFKESGLAKKNQVTKG